MTEKDAIMYIVVGVTIAVVAHMIISGMKKEK